jgi:hypothetical protein
MHGAVQQSNIPMIIAFGILLLFILAGLANLYFRLRSRRITDEQLVECWAKYGTGRLMLANQYGITNEFYSGNPAGIPPGEFVVRKEILDVWWRVYYAWKWVPKRLEAASAGAYARLGGVGAAVWYGIE